MTTTYEMDHTKLGDVLELLGREGFGGMGDAMRVLVNEIMKIQRSAHLRAAPHERTEHREGYANGYKPKTVKTRVGEITVAVPQTRGTDFYPSALEKGIRSEKALTLALAEMYIQGVSTRKVAAITEKLCGTDVTSMEVSRAAALLDESLEAWRNRPLSETPYLILDARYEKVRHGGQVVDCAVLIALGVTKSGHRSVLGCSVSLGEHEVHWRNFLRGLKERGLCGVNFMVSDAHEGLKAARRAMFPKVTWQRCQFHLQHNAQSYVPRTSMKTTVANDIRQIFDASDDAEAKERLERFILKYKKTAPDLATWAETALPEGLAVLKLPPEHRKRMRTSNMLERLNKEIKRRTKVATLFPNEASCLRLISAVLAEVSEEWESGRIYLNMETLNLKE